MKLLLENWRKYLTESQIHPKIEAQLQKLLATGYKFDITAWGSHAGGHVSIDIKVYKTDPEPGRKSYAVPSETEGKYWDRYGELAAGYSAGRGPCNFAAVISGGGTEALHGWGLMRARFPMRQKLFGIIILTAAVTLKRNREIL